MTERLLENKTDYQLIQLTKLNNSDALEELFYRYSPIIKRLCKDYFVRGYSNDDILQEARLSLLVAVQKYEGDEEKAFGSFYKVIFRNRMITLIRASMTSIQRINSEAVSLDGISELNNNDALFKSPTREEPSEVFKVREVMQDYFDDLSKFEKQVYRLYMAGYLIEEIALMVNKSKSQISNAYDRCRSKLRQKIQSDK